MKVIKGFFTLLGVIFFLLIAVVVFTGFSILDDTDNSKKEIVNNPKDLTVLINDYIEGSMENTAENEKVSLLLAEDETNYVLAAVKEMIDLPVVNIKSIYSIYKDDGTVTFEAPVSFMAFNSCVRGNVHIYLDDNHSLNVKVNSISLGKLSSSDIIFKLLIGMYVDFDSIEEELNENGIPLSLSYDDGVLSAVMTQEQMKSLAATYLNENGMDKIVDCVLDAVIEDNELFSFKFNDDKKIGAEVYLSALSYNLPLEYDLYSGTSNINTVKEKMLTLLNGGVADNENKDIVFNFLVRGYSVLTDEEKAEIDKLSFDSINISEPEEYEGIVERSSLTMAKIFLDVAINDPLEILSIITQGKYDITIRESTLNELLNSLDFIGTSFIFANEEMDKISNITISSLYAELLDQSIKMYLVMDINGKYINAEVNAEALRNEGALITLKVQDVYLGTKELEENVKKELLEFLSGVLTEVDYISVNSEENLLKLDFSSYLTDGFFATLVQRGMNKISVTMSSENNGQLIIRLSKN